MKTKKLSNISNKLVNKTAKATIPGTNNNIKTQGSAICILFTNQCWDLDIILPLLEQAKASTKPSELSFIIYEHPVFFGNIPGYGATLKFNRLKILYQLSVVRYYADIIQSRGYNVKIITDEPASKLTKFIARNTNLYYFDPSDVHIETELAPVLKKYKPVMLASPGFINTKPDLAEYHKTKSNPDSYMHAGFYNWMRDKVKILPGHKTYDTENRNKLPLNISVPALPAPHNPDKFIDMAIKIIEKHPAWNKNPGPTTSSTMLKFPITHAGAVNALEQFCKDRFHDFGKYQDSIDSKGRNFLFHSCISPMLNIGLLTPGQVLDTIKAYNSKHSIPMASYEGFIRQIIGWREYQRYIYIYAGDKMRASNHFNNKYKLGPAWYHYYNNDRLSETTKKTGIKPLDDAIEMAWRDGYLHHILRLMVVGNIMNLAGINPDEAYRWFMEFSLDSYDWVMVGNVYSMALWSDAGLTMRKPYISSSAYILKMSTYPARAKSPADNWPATWDSLFHHFINRTQDKLIHTYYAGLVKAWKKKGKEAQYTELKPATEFIKSISSG